MRILATAASEVGKSLTQPNGQSGPSIGSYSMDLVASFDVTEPFLQQKPANVHLLTAGLYAAARKALPYFHLCPLNPKHVAFPVIEETKNFPASEEKLRKYFSWPSQVRDSSNGKRKFLDVSLRVISPVKIGTLKHHSAGLSDLLRKRGKAIFLDQKQASGHVLELYGVVLGAHPTMTHRTEMLLELAERANLGFDCSIPADERPFNSWSDLVTVDGVSTQAVKLFGPRINKKKFIQSLLSLDPTSVTPNEYPLSHGVHFLPLAATPDIPRDLIRTALAIQNSRNDCARSVTIEGVNLDVVFEPVNTMGEEMTIRDLINSQIDTDTQKPIFEYIHSTRISDFFR